MTDPKISIIVPVYNVEAYVGKTLASIFNTDSDIEDFEVIVINDGTKDRSMDIIRQYDRHANMTVLEQENQGLSAARMKGASAAKGEYLWFVDSDDMLVENGVGKVLRLLEDKPGIDVFMYPIMWIYEDTTKNHPDYCLDSAAIVSGKEVIRDLHLPVWCTPRFVIKRSLFSNKWLFFPLGLVHEDEYFGAVLMCIASAVYVNEDPVYLYYIRSRSIMTTPTVKKAYDMVSNYRLLIEFKDSALGQSDKPWFHLHCVNRLITTYSKNTQFYGSLAFSRFVRKNGFFIWRQWKSIYPNTSLKNSIGRLFFFMMPDLRTRIIRKTEIH